METIVIKVNPNDPADPNGTERRTQLINLNVPMIERTYHMAIKAGTREPMVLILDTSDPFAMEMVRSYGSPDHIATFGKVVGEEIPTAWAYLERWPAYRAFTEIQKNFFHRIDPQKNPKVSPVVEMLSSPAPTGHAWVLVISKGKQAAPVPISSRPVEEQSTSIQNGLRLIRHINWSNRS